MAPSSAERIDRMAADGLITPKQAEMLRASLSSPSAAVESAQTKPRRQMLWPALAMLAAVVAIVLSIVQPGGGPAEVQDVSAVFNQPDGMGAMNRSLMGTLVIILLAAVGAGVFLWTYNGLIDREEKVFAAWGQVESNLQRRADLTPQLIEIVARYLRHEGQTFQNVAESRTQDLAGLQSAIEELTEATEQSTGTLQGEQRIVEDEESLGALAAAQARMDRSIRTLIATAEAYPELRSSDQFLSLQAQLEGTENRLNVTRMRFNELAGEYNSAIRRVPGALVAGAGSFRRKAYFEAERQARDAPELGLD